MMRRQARTGRIRALALTALTALALPVPAVAASAPAQAAPLQSCRLRGVEHAALCGVLRRPLDPQGSDQAGAPGFELHYAVLPALSRHKKADPVFFFAGGPGQSAIDLAGPVGRLLARFSTRRDIVLIDQRGTGRSAPLRCDDDQPGRPLRESADPALQLQALERCRQALQKLPHGDLRHYTTTLAMQDAEAVRLALGAARINLVGISYGTRAALEYQRQFPRAVRRVVLDGVAPPDMVLPASFAVDAQAALDALLAWCQADSACRQRHPDLRQQWQGLRATLPREVTLQHPLTGREESLRLSPDMLAGLVRASLYSPLLTSALPLAIDAAAGGRWAPLAGLALAQSGGGRAGALAQGMHFSVICAEDLPLYERAEPTPGTDFGALGTELYRRACAGWPRGEVPADFYRVSAAPVPVLLLSGAIDPATPPRHGHRVAQALGPRARHLVVPNAGHGVLGLGCLRDLVYRFVNADDEAEALALDLGCAEGLPRPSVYRGLAPEAAR
jgi:pimeloyl-ACP methyl ester carboxylesterase